MRTTLPRASRALVTTAGTAAVAIALLANTPLAGFLVGDRDNLALEPVVLTTVAWRIPQPEPSAEPEPRAASQPESPREAVVVMGDGTRYTGMLVSQDDQHVVVEVGGIDLRLNADDVARIDILPPIRERYARLRAATADDDIPARLNLVNWLVGRSEYELAGEELTGIMEAEPRHPRALELRRIIDAAILLNAPGPDQPEGGDPEGPEGDPDRPLKDPIQVLSAEEINLIRVYELDLERLPRIIIRRETVERLIEENVGDPLIPSTIEGRDDLIRSVRSNPRRVLDLIFRLKARHLYPEIQVIDNPRAMQMFRERVHSTWLINACATCHNTDADAPRGPRLVTRRPNSDATVYSNFLILDRYRLADGTALIDYDNPGASPLLHMGMPRVTAEFPHPDVAAARGWSPVFLSNNTNSYQNALTWIRSMYRPRPDYPIDYPPRLEDEAGPISPPVER